MRALLWTNDIQSLERKRHQQQKYKEELDEQIRSKSQINQNNFNSPNSNFQ